MNDFDDEEDELTAVPEIPLALSQPVVPENTGPAPEVPILIGLPGESPPSPSPSNTSPSPSDTSPGQQPDTDTTPLENTRPRRTSKPPKYLQDYVW